MKEDNDALLLAIAMLEAKIVNDDRAGFEALVADVAPADVNLVGALMWLVHCILVANDLDPARQLAIARRVALERSED